MRRALGSTGVDVNAIGLGTWPLSRPGRPSRSQAIEVIRTAVEAGVDFIDTADCYAVDDSEFGYGECLVNEALGHMFGKVMSVSDESMGRYDTTSLRAGWT